MSLARKLRALLILGRVSNLPTVWSNCLAGWFLGGATFVEKLPFVFVGVSLLYVGGMFLNDAFDVEFDTQHRRERPIPSGAISLSGVWRWGTVWLLIGATALFFAGLLAGILGLLLAGCIVFYDAIHKNVSFGPVLMGACRLLIYLIAAGSAAGEITPTVVWCGLAVAGYIIGLSFIARRESTAGALSYWPLVPLAAPILLALLRNSQGYRGQALLLAAVLALWIAKSLRYALSCADRNIGRSVSGLLAGIVLVDWLAVANAPREISAAFIVLFLLAIGLQRLVPAT